MEDFQRWKDIQGSIDGTMGVNDLENRIEKLEEGFRKIESKIKGEKSRRRVIEVEEKGLLNQAKP